MAGKIQTQTYKINLDTSDLINSYREAIEQMRKAGAKGGIVDGLTKDLDKLERQFRDLSNEGSFGVEGSRGIENFDKKAQRLYTSLGALSKEMQKLTRDNKNFTGDNLVSIKNKIEEIKKKSKNMFGNVASQLQSLGVNSDITSALGQEIKGRRDLEDSLRRELALRQQIAHDARVQADLETRDITARQARKGYKMVNTSDVNRISGVSTEDRNAAISLINNEISRGIRSGAELETVLQNIDEVLETIGVTSEEFFKDSENLEEQIDVLIQQTDQMLTQSRALQELNDAVEQREQIGHSNPDGSISFSPEVNAALEDMSALEQQATDNAQELTEAMEELQEAEDEATVAMASLDTRTDLLESSTDSAAQEQRNLHSELRETASAAEETKQAFANIRDSIMRMLSITGVLEGFKQIIRNTFNDVKQLDASFASIAMVTDKSVQGMWASYGHYAEMAQELGQSTDSVIQASALFYQQGLEEQEALSLTADTMKLATLAGIDFSKATTEMTAAIRGFKMEMEDGGHVTDVYSTLAANAAAKVEDIAAAMSRTASIANSAGMSFENTSAFLTQMIETTQESAENIGTSLKTIIARFTELKENVAGTGDSEFADLDFNKVDKALKSVGVQLKDTTGQFRNLDDVFLELSKKWDTLDRNTQRYVATIAAGSRQQSRFIAMMDNYERTAELMDIAANSEGKADEQFAKYADTMEYKLNQLSTTWQEFRINFLNSDLFKGAISAATDLISRLNGIKFDGFFNITKNIGALVVGIITARKQFSNMSAIFTSTVKSIGSGLNLIKEKFTKFKPTIKPKVDTKALANDIKAGIDLISNRTDVSIRLNTQSFRDDILLVESEADNAEQQLRQAFINAGLSVEDYEATLQQCGGDIRALQDIVLDLDKNFQQLEGAQVASKKAAAQSQILNTALNALGSSLAMVVSGTMSLGEGMQFAATQMLTMLAPMALQVTIEYLLAKAKQKRMAATIGATVATAADAGANTALAAAEIAATVAAGPLIIVLTAAAAAIAVVVLLISKAIKNHEAEQKALKKSKDATIQYEEAVRSLNSAKSNLANTRSEVKELQEQRDTISDMVTEYERLKAKAGKTTEEVDRMHELEQQIKDNYPELISYEDEQTHQLTLQANKQQEIIDKLDEQIAKKKELLSLEQGIVSVNQASEQDAKNFQSVSKKLFDTDEYKFDATSKTDRSLIDAIVNRDIKAQLGSDGYVINLVDGSGKTIANMKGDNGYEIAFVEKIEQILGGDSTNYNTGAHMADIFNYITGATAELDEALFKDNVAIYQKKLSSIRQDIQAIQDSQLSVFEMYRDTAKQVVAKNSDMSQKEANLYGLVTANKTDAVPVFDDIFADAVSKGDVNAAKIEDNDIQALGSAIVDKLGLKGDFSSEIQDLKDAYAAIAGIYGDEEKGIRNNWSKVTGQAGYNALFESMGLTDEESYHRIFGEGDMSDNEAAKILAKAFQASLIEKQIEQVYGEVANDPKIQELIQQALFLDENMMDMSVDTFQQKLREIKDGLAEVGQENIADEIFGSLENDPTKVNDALTRVREAYGNALYGLKMETQIAFDNLFTSSLESMSSESTTKGFTNAVAEIFKNSSINEDLWTQLLDIPWDTINTQEDLDKLEETWVKNAKDLGVEGAQEIWNSLEQEANNWQALKIPFDMDDIRTQIEKVSSAVDSLGDSIVNSVKDTKENGEISLKTFESMKKSMEELHLNVFDYVNIDDKGKITASKEQLDKLYQDQLLAERNILETRKAELKAKIADIQAQQLQLENQYQAIEAGDGIVTVWADINQQTVNEYNTTLEWIKLLNSIDGINIDISGAQTLEYVSYHSLSKEQQEKMQAAFKQQKEAYDAQVTLYQAQVDAIDDELENKSKVDAARYRDYQKNMLDAEAATDKAADAQKKYADALKDVADKQDDLNEKLKKYNELLYGKDNRKSGLDFLYNYDQAIDSFSEDVDRAKEAMEDSSSVEEATQALKDYAAATHSLLAEQHAKRNVIAEGLNNYRDMIENGTTSYTNRETGETTNVRFGDYARYDERTGKYVLNQQLLNRAKFNDSFKDLIEQNIETYNDYYEKMRSLDDDILKEEKELKKQREQALKDYAAMETELAEALKEAYEEEIDNLKDKYDSMKDADDDYLDALRDAIEKQRKLRDQEKKFDDLAKKEKKLSLMQRDTSGSNELETRKLEEEIEDDREALLDEAIDNIIDGLSELYESQQELRDEEVELKEAIVDNTAYWNAKAESMAMSFESAEEYAQYLSSLSEEYANMTLAQQQVKLNEYGETYTAASAYMAMVAMDTASETGDFIVDVTNVTGDEVSQIIADTAQTFTDEVVRSYNETTEAFKTDLKSAEDEIDNARKALQDAIDKLNEYAQAAANVNYGGSGLPPGDGGPAGSPRANLMMSLASQIGVSHYAINGGLETYADPEERADFFEKEIIKQIPKLDKSTAEYLHQKGVFKTLTELLGVYVGRVRDQVRVFDSEKERDKWVEASAIGGDVKKYAGGGLVNYTGPAWVDGTPSQPEAFLSAEDTLRIGNAAKILSDLPLLSDYEQARSTINNTVGDTNIEIHMNIDHISSDMDLDEVVGRVKDEVVAVARPAGTNVILNQRI